jgi:hypothetical protein
VVLGAGRTAVNGVRPSLFAPILARTLSESTLALDQSIAASSPSQLSSLESNFSQTPATCQSCSRRQQVVPLPQPNSFGSSRHGQPVRSTNTMPPRAARSGTRGRPPFGFGGSLGCRGSIASQRSSETRNWLKVTDHDITSPVLKHGAKTEAVLQGPAPRASVGVHRPGPARPTPVPRVRPDGGDAIPLQRNHFAKTLAP